MTRSDKQALYEIRTEIAKVGQPAGWYALPGIGVWLHETAPGGQLIQIIDVGIYHASTGKPDQGIPQVWLPGNFDCFETAVLAFSVDPVSLREVHEALAKRLDDSMPIICHSDLYPLVLAT